MAGEMGGMTKTVRFLQEENQRLLELNEELREENSYLRECLKSIMGLQRVVTGLDVQAELESLLNRIIYEAVRLVDAVDGSLLLIDEERKELVFAAVRSDLQEMLQGFRIPLDTGIAGWVASQREAVIANDVSQDERFSTMVDSTIQFRTQSLLCVPLLSRRKVLGVIELVNNFSGRPFEQRDLDMVLTLAPIAATAIDLAGLASQE